jgi:hypothetical protein
MLCVRRVEGLSEGGRSLEDVRRHVQLRLERRATTSKTPANTFNQHIAQRRRPLIGFPGMRCTITVF